MTEDAINRFAERVTRTLKEEIPKLEPQAVLYCELMRTIIHDIILLRSSMEQSSKLGAFTTAAGYELKLIGLVELLESSRRGYTSYGQTLSERVNNILDTYKEFVRHE